jgi:hypothetical protein
MKTPDSDTGRGRFVLHDEPTLSDLSDAPTLLDMRNMKRKRPPSPVWPIPRPPERRPPERGRSPLGWAIAAALGASAVLLLSVLCLLAVISLTSGTGIFASSGPSGRPVSAASTTSPSASASASPVPTSGWLQVAPATAQFGCADHQRTQIVVLENHGPHIVHWQATLSLPADQAGVAITPGDGELGAGESTAIQLQSTSESARQQVVIRFSVTDAQAGAPASVSVTAAGCN